MAENDPYRLPGDVNPYAPPESELAPLTRAYAPAAYAPGLEPFSIDASLRRSWAVYQQRLGVVMAIVLGAGGINVGYQLGGNAVVAATTASNAGPTALLAVNAVYLLTYMALQFWITMGLTMGLLKLARGQETEFAEIFRGGRFVLRYIGAALLCGLAVVPVFLVCLIPAGVVIALSRGEPSGAAIAAIIALVGLGAIGMVVISVRLLLFPYVLVDRDCGPMDSIRGSFEISRGHVMELFGVSLLSGLISISGVLACGVGLLFTYPLGLLIPVTAYVLLVGGGFAGQGPKLRSDLEFLDFES